jgi:hypothetical protein
MTDAPLESIEVRAAPVLVHLTGNLSAGAGKARFVAPFDGEVVGVTVATGGGPVGDDLIFDVNVAGVTVYTTQANRPTVASGGTASGATSVPDSGQFDRGDVLTVDVDQIGDVGVNEEQTITRTATGGDVDITFDGQTAVAVPVVAATTAADIETALEGLSNIAPADVGVTGPAGGPFVVEFTGVYAATDVPEIIIDDTNATGGTVVVATTTPGVENTPGSDAWLFLFLARR